MTVRDSIECSFRDLVLIKPYEKISVACICEAANVSRSMFYMYFDDKLGLLYRIFEKDLIEPTQHLRRVLPAKKIKSAEQFITEQIYIGVLTHKDFYSKINNINNHIVLISIITDQLTEMNNTLLVNADIPESEKTYYSYFSAASQAMLISRWIEKNYDTEPAQLAQFYRKWILGYWENILHFEPEWT